MTALMPRLFGNVDEWIESGFPMSGTHVIRVEEFETNGVEVIRAELPGLDPDKDIKISVANGMLTIEAERSAEQVEEKQGRRRSEFRYGSLRRVASLPSNAQEKDIKARYDKGILEVTVPLRQEESAGRAIPIETT